MSTERPSEADVERFVQMMELKKYTGAWHGTLPVVLTGSAIFGYFTYSIFKSMNPAGIVPRILYEQSLPFYQRHFRHFKPWLILLTSLAAFDIYNGVWDSADN